MALDDSELDGDEVNLSDSEDKTEYWNDCREGWNKHLAEFEKEMYYPVFAKFGISKNNAFLMWHLNCMKNILDDIRGDEDEDGTWKRR